MESNKAGKEIDLKALYTVIKKRFWILVLCTVIFTSLGIYYVSIPRMPLYESSIRLHVQAGTDLLSTVKVIIREPAVLEEVIKELQINRSPGALREQISVATVEGSTVLRLSVVDPNPVLAAEIANTIVASYQQVARNTVFFASIIVLTEAEVNETPINPKSNRAAYAGMIAGILLGIGMVFLLDSLDDTLKSEQEIEELLGLTVLGHAAKIKKKDIVKRTKQKNLSLRGESIGP